jgi:hypothetical protein
VTAGYLATRPLLPQHDRAALIDTNNVKRVLANTAPTTAGESLTAMARRWSEVKIGDALLLRW